MTDIKSYSPCEAFIGKYNPKNPLERSFEWKGGPRSLGEYKIDHFEFYSEHKSKKELERLRSEQMLDADIKMVISQTNCTREEAIKSLQKNGNDIVNAIFSLLYDKN